MICSTVWSVRPPRWSGVGGLLLAFDLQVDIDELVFLAADELALPGPVQHLDDVRLGTLRVHQAFGLTRVTGVRSETGDTICT